MCGRRIADRGGRLDPLARWAKGFAYELDTDHRVVDDILCRWTTVARRLADPAVPFASAKEEAVDVAVGLRDLLQRHLEVEDRDILPLYWRHYTAAEFDVVYHQAIKGGKKKGTSFVVPWNVYCLDPQRRTTLVGLAPLPLKLVWWATRRRFSRLEGEAFGTVEVDLSDLESVGPA